MGTIVIHSSIHPSGWKTGVGEGSRHGREHVGDFGHQQQGQRTQAFAPRPHVGAATRLPEINCQAITLHYT